MIKWDIEPDGEWQSLTMGQRLLIKNKTNRTIAIEINKDMVKGRIVTEVELKDKEDAQSN